LREHFQLHWFRKHIFHTANACSLGQLSIILAGEAIDLWLLAGGHANFVKELSHLQGSIHAAHYGHVAFDEDQLVE